MSILLRGLACFCGLLVLSFGAVVGADDEKPKAPKPTGTLTSLGTIKGELVKVSDGGNKITVKYKETVPVSQTVHSGMLGRVAGTYGKFHPPAVKEWSTKEKSQDLEMRVLEKAVIRILSSKDLPSDDKGKGNRKKEDASDDDDDGATMKGKEKAAVGKGAKKSSEQKLPGKAGDIGSLVKGQVVIVNVMREDFSTYNRLVTNSIYILGEK